MALFRHPREVLEAFTCFADAPLEGVSKTEVQKAYDAIFSLPFFAALPEAKLFPTVKRWALESMDMPPDVSPLGLGAQRELSARQCRGLLANATLGNLQDLMTDCKRHQGGLDFWRHIRTASLEAPCCGVAAHKQASILLYFAEAMREDGSEDERVVCFHRLKCPDVAEIQMMLSTSTEPVMKAEAEGAAQVQLHEAPMEDAIHLDRTCRAFVNFANAEFGYGCFISSATQEEILQMCCPEFNVGLLFLGRMADSEVVNVYGCRRYTTYSGYLDTYRCTGLLQASSHQETPVIHDILTIDACMHRHFEEQEQLRDIRKAFTAFHAYSTLRGRDADGQVPAIATGRWGCGAFGGLPAHKFVQQVLAGRLADVRLCFSTFGEPAGCDKMLDLLRQEPRVSLMRTWDVLRRQKRGGFEDTFCAGLAEGSLRAGAGSAIPEEVDLDV